MKTQAAGWTKDGRGMVTSTMQGEADLVRAQRRRAREWNDMKQDIELLKARVSQLESERDGR